jgi:hypothetical protein
MVNEIVVIDSKLDRLLCESPGDAIRLIAQEYQIACDKDAFVMALATKLVLGKARASI